MISCIKCVFGMSNAPLETEYVSKRRIWSCVRTHTIGSDIWVHQAVRRDFYSILVFPVILPKSSVIKLWVAVDLKSMQACWKSLVRRDVRESSMIWETWNAKRRSLRVTKEILKHRYADGIVLDQGARKGRNFVEIYFDDKPITWLWTDVASESGDIFRNGTANRSKLSEFQTIPSANNLRGVKLNRQNM